jgi:hypothetical protein
MAEQSRAARELYTGACVNGPAQWLTLVSRFPGGIILVDKGQGKYWKYEFRPGLASGAGTFSTNDVNGKPYSWEVGDRFATGSEYDVISYDKKGRAT